jgi:hypothetical protein
MRRRIVCAVETADPKGATKTRAARSGTTHQPQHRAIRAQSTGSAPAARPCERSIDSSTERGEVPESRRDGPTPSKTSRATSRGPRRRRPRRRGRVVEPRRRRPRRRRPCRRRPRRRRPRRRNWGVEGHVEGWVEGGAPRARRRDCRPAPSMRPPMLVPARGRHRPARHQIRPVPLPVSPSPRRDVPRRFRLGVGLLPSRPPPGDADSASSSPTRSAEDHFWTAQQVASFLRCWVAPRTRRAATSTWAPLVRPASTSSRPAASLWSHEASSSPGAAAGSAGRSHSHRQETRRRVASGTYVSRSHGNQR